MTKMMSETLTLSSLSFVAINEKSEQCSVADCSFEREIFPSLCTAMTTMKHCLGMPTVNIFLRYALILKIHNQKSTKQYFLNTHTIHLSEITHKEVSPQSNTTIQAKIKQTQ